MAESGHNPGSGDGSAAFDNKNSTSWRPQCYPCNANAAWLTFSTTAKAQCLSAGNLGRNYHETYSWNGGIKVEIQNSDKSWTTAMQSESGNSADSGNRLK